MLTSGSALLLFEELERVHWKSREGCRADIRVLISWLMWHFLVWLKPRLRQLSAVGEKGLVTPS
jgi:hypothetical protein